MVLLEKNALNKGMWIYNFAFIKGQGFYGQAEHPYQNIISVPPPVHVTLRVMSPKNRKFQNL